MPDTLTAMDNRTLLRKTLITVGVMVGANVVVVGLLLFIAVVVVGHALNPPTADNDKGGDIKNVPTANVHGVVPGAAPKGPPPKIPSPK